MAMLLVCGMAQAADEGKVLKLTSPDGVNEVTFSKPGRELTYQAWIWTTACGRWPSASATCSSRSAGWTC